VYSLQRNRLQPPRLLFPKTMAYYQEGGGLAAQGVF